MSNDPIKTLTDTLTLLRVEIAEGEAEEPRRIPARQRPRRHQALGREHDPREVDRVIRRQRHDPARDGPGQPRREHQDGEPRECGEQALDRRVRALLH